MVYRKGGWREVRDIRREDRVGGYNGLRGKERLLPARRILLEIVLNPAAGPCTCA